jgi:heme-degrading monooxygenase HmoA
MIRFAAAFALAALPAVAQDFTVPFTDTAPQDPEFAAWRAGLFLDVIRRDVDAVVEKADPGIRFSFGGDGGQESFRDWLTSDAEAEAHWRAIEEVLALGGSFQSADSFAAPYMFTAELPETFDVYATYFVLGQATPIRIDPEPDAEVIATVTGAVVQATNGEDFEEPYREVVRSDGSRGFVETPLLRSVIDYRALFNRIDGDWRMTAFIAGD